MRLAGAGLAILGIVGCGGTRSPASPVPVAGRYTFLERVSGGTAVVVLEGEIEIRPDTVLIEARPGPCLYEPSRSTPLGVVYQCGRTTFSFDRGNPVERAYYSTVVTVLERRTTCIRYTADRICAESRTDVIERDAPRSGRLRLKPGD